MKVIEVFTNVKPLDHTTPLLKLNSWLMVSVIS